MNYDTYEGGFMIEILKKSLLFKGMKSEEIDEYLKFARASVKNYKRGESIFMAGDYATELYILLSGEVAVENITLSGKKTIVNVFDKPGTVFAEVYLYIDEPLHHSASATKDSALLAIKKEYIVDQNHNYKVLIDNIISILANKAYYLNKKLMICTAKSIRHKIINYLLINDEGDFIRLPFTKTAFAEFLSVPRPSLSRELSQMKDEGLIEERANKIYFSRAKLEDLL